DKTPMAAICQYPFWMVFGWIAYTYRPTKRFRHLIYALGVAALLAGIWFNLYNWIHTGDMNVVATTQKFSILMFLKNVALFYFIVTVFRNHEFSERAKKYLRKLSDSTLIIYLIHMLFIYYMYDHNFLYESGTMTPWVGAWIYAIIAYLGGGIVAEIFHTFWNPIKKKLKKQKA
ncbi:MAG: acyltransferase family protein, partial [Erysipelotrichaceae bacterium]|nr:acyltransferase family protein [Erysipelotrichaceae bacterium]